jgi:antitoxin component of MazEF toxin-antitoxin module
MEVRKIQRNTDGTSLSVVIPNNFCEKLGLRYGDLMMMRLDAGNKIILSEKVDLSPSVLAQAGVTMYPPPSELRDKGDYTSI